MKINRRLIVIISIAVFVIALAFLYLNYQKQVTAQTSAQQDLTAANSSLTIITSSKTKAQTQLDQDKNQLNDLQGQLAQTQQNLAEKQQILPLSVGNIDYNEIIFNVAGSCNLTILTLTSSPPVANSANNLSFSVSGFDITLQGQMSDVLNFIHTVATDSRFAGGVIDAVSTSKVTIDTPSGSQDAIQAGIHLSLYSYKGS